MPVVIARNKPSGGTRMGGVLSRVLNGLRERVKAHCLMSSVYRWEICVHLGVVLTKMIHTTLGSRRAFSLRVIISSHG
jgi:hypothetical protein